LNFPKQQIATCHSFLHRSSGGTISATECFISRGKMVIENLGPLSHFQIFSETF